MVKSSILNVIKPMISAVIPVYNEQGSIKKLYDEVFASLTKIGDAFEIIIVDDGSTDNTLVEIQSCSPLKIVRFTKNFGQTAAFDAGIKISKGNIVVTLDGDGQNDPKDIDALLIKLNQGFDLVTGWRHQRKDPVTKRFISFGARILRNILIKDSVHDSGCSLKAIRKDCLKDIDLHGEMHRFIPALFVIQGYKVAEIPVNHRPRITGSTKYTVSRTLKGFIDMISIWFWRTYSARPLHLFGGMGLFSFLSGSVLITVLFVLRIFNVISLWRSIWPLVGFFLVLTGIQLFVAGILADILMKSYFKSSKSESYTIKEILDTSISL
jgi:glycosyltransferase involved in cell wall biosynthesis